MGEITKAINANRQSILAVTYNMPSKVNAELKNGIK